MPVVWNLKNWLALERDIYRPHVKVKEVDSIFPDLHKFVSSQDA